MIDFSFSQIVIVLIGYAFSSPCPRDRSQTEENRKRFAIKSFSSGKYLKVDGDVASDTLSVSFTGHFNACDTRIRELTFVFMLNVALSSVWAIIGKDLMDMYINHNKKSQILGLTSTLC